MKTLEMKFDKKADERVKKRMAPQFGADPGGGVVRGGAFRARRNEQIKIRKSKERRAKIASVRSGY
jgi:hypothetical protein